MKLRQLMVWGTILALGACQQGGEPFGFLKSAPKAEEGAAEGTAPATSSRLVERDVEAPEVFSANEDALWDGRPSLGGVWVAHPGVKDPERVIIRNPANGKFVIGALFRRERDNPGPKLQLSSDAAAALDILAGAPSQVSVVALRREEAPPETAAPLVSEPVIAAPEAIASAPLGEPGKPGDKPGEKPGAKPGEKPAADLAAAAGAAIAAAETKPAETKPAAPAKPGPAKSASGKMSVQIGIFSVEANAKRAAEQMAKAGITATVRTEASQGKTFWSVVAGPAANTAERDALLKKIKGLGYADAYAVSK